MLIVILVIAAAGVTAAGIVAAALYLRVVGRIRDERRQTKDLDPVDNCYISRSSLLSLSHNFTEGESEVYWADRQHWLAFWPAGIMLMLVAGICVGGALAIAAHPAVYTLRINSAQHPRYLHIQLVWLLWLPLLLALLSAASAWFLWLRWRAVFRLITNQNLLLETQPWPWAFWLWNDEKHDPQPFHSIISAEPSGTFWGRTLGYGTVEVKTYQMENRDAPLHTLAYVRRYKDFSKLLNGLRQKASEGGPADTGPRPLRRA